MDNRLALNIQSEIGRLNAVILHNPGAEVENMTPRDAQRALYSDILNLEIAQHEYKQLEGVLSKVTKVYKVHQLLVQVLNDMSQRASLLRKICANENALDYYDELFNMTSEQLATALIEGQPARINTLTSYLNDDYYALYPLYNFYFTRDASVTIGNNALICKMANRVRMRESFIMEAIFRGSGEFRCNVLNAYDFGGGNEIHMEGGDILIARNDILLVGNGCRTSTQGIDALIQNLCAATSVTGGKQHVIVQQLPDKPESFIHLDMVFTMLDVDKCMVFEPLIMHENQYQTVHIQIDGGKVSNISRVSDIPAALRKLGMDLKPLKCGGSEDEWYQEREQWHSGANFFAIEPGKVLSYARNIHTLNELSKNGFEIVPAWDIVNGKVDYNSLKKCVITIEGSELPRGGGGARCMTMPVNRCDL